MLLASTLKKLSNQCTLTIHINVQKLAGNGDSKRSELTFRNYSDKLERIFGLILIQNYLIWKKSTVKLHKKPWLVHMKHLYFFWFLLLLGIGSSSLITKTCIALGKK